MPSNLLVITQTVNLDDPDLSFFHAWLENLASRVSQLYVICLFEGRHALPANVQVLSLGKEQGVSRFKYLWRFYQYIFQYRKKYGGVFIHMNPEYAVLGGLFWKLWGKKTALWYVHKTVNLKLWLAEKFVDKIFTASPESFRLSSKKVEIVGHGIDTDFFTPLQNFALQNLGGQASQQSYKLLTIGRLSPSKDLKTLILAVGELSKMGASVSLDIVGAPARPEDEKYLAELKQLVRVNQLDGAVNFLGGVSYESLPEIYRAHNVFLHASRTGSMDKVVLEALACGLLVFTSSRIYDKFLGIYQFKEGDYLSLAQAIANHPSTNNEASVAYIKENYNLDHLIERIVNFYK